jgi:hypothetical protein
MSPPPAAGYTPPPPYALYDPADPAYPSAATYNNANGVGVGGVVNNGGTSPRHRIPAAVRNGGGENISGFDFPATHQPLSGGVMGGSSSGGGGHGNGFGVGGSPPAYGNPPHGFDCYPGYENEGTVDLGLGGHRGGPPTQSDPSAPPTDSAHMGMVGPPSYSGQAQNGIKF